MVKNELAGYELNLLTRNIFYVALLIIAMAGTYFVLINTTLVDLFSNLDLLVIRVNELGIFGPLLVIGLMALAIVFNPFPSAPIALAAGAVYGHVFGTIYIVTGAEIGAIIAFIIARIAGYELARKFLGDNLSLGRFGSQKALTMIVFLSRLVPFMSFDLISYAAGLTAIKLWRFALATLFGLIPVSFFLAHMGGKIVDSSGGGKVLVIVLIIGLFTLVPLLIGAVKRYRRDRQQKSKGLSL
jgi:uncharacterized membrane protein YdjX (TVP38/TMEM64 family)